MCILEFSKIVDDQFTIFIFKWSVDDINVTPRNW